MHFISNLENCRVKKMSTKLYINIILTEFVMEAKLKIHKYSCLCSSPSSNEKESFVPLLLLAMFLCVDLENN